MTRARTLSSHTRFYILLTRALPLSLRTTLAEKDPRFRPSMLEPPKPKFQTVSLTEGPIIKTVKMTQTGPKKKPHKWGPLGGWF